MPQGLKRGVENEAFYPAPQGEVLGLTLLVDFGDQEPAFTVDEVDAWLNGVDYREGGLNGSIRDYYADNSNGIGVSRLQGSAQRGLGAGTLFLLLAWVSRRRSRSR